MGLITADTHYLVVGLGATGLSCVRFLREQGKRVSVIDSREQPPGLSEMTQSWPEVPVYTGGFDEGVIATTDVLVMSPGVPLATPVIAAAIERGARITSDIELFSRAFQGRKVLITGSNAKSTVTSWLADMASLAKASFVVGGNLGQPALTLLDQDADLAILELSSFQLELLPAMNADVATVLNVSEDHLDRYPSFEAYQQAKQRVYNGCRHAVFNREDALTTPRLPDEVPTTSFGLDAPAADQFGLIEKDGTEWLARGNDAWLPVSEVALPGRHNLANALACLALGDAIGLPRVAMLESVRGFKGLPHRCELVATVDGVRYVNDSKGTNVGAALAAVEGLGREAQGRLILLVGGQGKDADFTALADPVRTFCKAVFAFGEDQAVLANALGETTHTVATMEDALLQASDLAEAGDTILLSPACASFDQFRNFEHRGDAFRSWVEGRV